MQIFQNPKSETQNTLYCVRQPISVHTANSYFIMYFKNLLFILKVLNSHKDKHKLSKSQWCWTKGTDGPRDTEEESPGAPGTLCWDATLKGMVWTCICRQPFIITASEITLPEWYASYIFCYLWIRKSTMLIRYRTNRASWVKPSNQPVKFTHGLWSHRRGIQLGTPCQCRNDPNGSELWFCCCCC